MGTVPGRPGSLRVSAKTRSWEQAESLARKYEITAAGGDEVKEARTLPTVKEAVKGYLADAEARGLAPATIQKLEHIFKKQFLAFSEQRRIIFLRDYQAKTGIPVFVPLPPHVADLLRSIPPGLKPNPNYFFWSGNGLPKTFVANWQRAYRRLFKVVDLRKLDGTPKRCHCHMFRDTFAVEMLLAGVPIDQVSILLGHSSVRVTEKHYSPWVRARQDQLEKSVQSAWQLLPEHKAVAS